MDLKLRKLIKNGALYSQIANTLNGATDKQINYPTYGMVDSERNASSFYNASGFNPTNIDINKISATGVDQKTSNTILNDAIDRANEADAAKAAKKEQVLGNVTDSLQSGLAFAGSLKNAFLPNTPDPEQLIRNAGTSEQEINGVKFRVINSFKHGKMPKCDDGLNPILSTATTGASFGSDIGGFFGPVGSAVGGVAGGLIGGVAGIFGGSSARRKQREAEEAARREAQSRNNFARTLALGTSLQLKAAEEGYANGKQPVYSAFGPTSAAQDSWVSKGEVAIDTRTGSRFRIPTGPNDTARFAGGKDPNIAIISNKYGLSDLAMVDPETAIDLQGVYKNAGKLNKSKGEFKNGKLPRRKEGWLPNALISGLGTLVGMDQYFSAKNQNVYSPNTFVSNPYESKALAGLGGLRYSYKPVYDAIADYGARQDYAINNSGALSGGQKYRVRLANSNNMYKNISNMLFDMQQRNLGLKSNYYNAMLNAGNAYAQRQQAANQYDLDYYSKAHAARQQQMNTGLYNALGSLQQYYANDFKRRQFNDTMALYRDDRKIERDKLKRLLGQ